MAGRRLAVIVPFRDRHEHLRTLLPVLSRHLRTIDYRVTIAEQADRRPFNKGTLINLAVLCNQDRDYYCVHDVDLVPAWRPGAASAYAYTRAIVHLAGRREQSGFMRPYPTYMGGVVLVNKEAFFAMNGWSNRYLVWGHEDDDAYARARMSGVRITFKNYRYLSLPHDTSYRGNHPHWKANRARFARMNRRETDYLSEGLCSVTCRSAVRERIGDVDWIKIVS